MCMSQERGNITGDPSQSAALLPLYGQLCVLDISYLVLSKNAFFFRTRNEPTVISTHISTNCILERSVWEDEHEENV